MLQGPTSVPVPVPQISGVPPVPSAEPGKMVGTPEPQAAPLQFELFQLSWLVARPVTEFTAMLPDPGTVVPLPAVWRAQPVQTVPRPMPFPGPISEI